MGHENETEKDRGSDADAIVKNVSIHMLHDFKNQPFKVENDTELFKLMKNIEREGVLVPLLARFLLYGFTLQKSNFKIYDRAKKFEIPKQLLRN